MKKTLKRSLCVFVVIIVLVSLVISGLFVRSIYLSYRHDFFYSDNKNDLNEWLTVLEQYPLREYLNPLPSWYSVEDNYERYKDILVPEKDHMRIFLTSTCPYYVTYKYSYGKILENKTVYSFDVNKRLCSCYNCYDRNKIKLLCYYSTLSRRNSAFYSDIECILAYYDKGFERNKEYILFPLSGYLSPDSKDFTTARIEFFAVGYLDEEYPYIAVYPGDTRYDATSFGADSKYVTKDEFIDLVGDKVKQTKDRLAAEDELLLL